MSYPNPIQNPYNNPVQRKPTKKGNPVLWIILGVVGFVLLLGIAGIVGLVMFISSLRNESTSLKQIVAKDGVTEISVPTSWKVDIMSHPEASIEAGNIFAENYSVVLTERKDELPGATFDQYYEIVLSNMRNGSPFLKFDPPVETTINGLTARNFRVQGNVDGVPIVYYNAVVESDRHFHQIMTWTLVNRETKNAPILTQVRDSFKVR